MGSFFPYSLRVKINLWKLKPQSVDELRECRVDEKEVMKLSPFPAVYKWS